MHPTSFFDSLSTLMSQNKIETPLLSGTELLQKQAEEPQGLATGLTELDSNLLWQGAPRSALSLFIGKPGWGSTSLWLEMARRVGNQKRWSLWISNQTTLFAPALWNRGVSLKHLYVVRSPESTRDWEFALRECLDSQIFTLIGCEVETLSHLKKSLPKLRRLTEKSKSALVFLSNDQRDLKRTHDFHWVTEFEPNKLHIHKAKNRPSFQIPWRGTYANLLSQFPQASQSLHHRGLSEIHSTSALSRTGSDFRRDPSDFMDVQKFEKPA